VVYPIGSEIEVVTRPGYEGFAISVGEDHLAELARAAGLPSPTEVIDELEVFECNPSVVLAIQLGLRAFGETVTRLPEIRQDRLRRELEFELPTDLLHAIAGGRGSRARTGATTRFRIRTVERVLNYVAAFPRQPLTVEDVCRVAGASERTIQKAFLERFGVRPKAYLRDRRLNGARRELRTLDLTMTVAEIATRWGFWHMGQFARDYRRLFSELPSDTRRRTMRNY
jgi:AraC family ethanolamine operon transcriptional activator